MTMIDVDTSPLQAAREWRGIGLVSAALSSGLPVASAEALETGDISAFDSIDEMIASAVMYGSCLGIGRDEAMALLDRTVTHVGAKVNLPDPDADSGPPAFTSAVRERSARIAGRDVDTTVASASDPIVAPAISSAVLDEPTSPAALNVRMPEVPGWPTAEQAVAASAEIHIDEEFGPEAPWERIGQTGELESWAADEEFGDVDAPVVRSRGRSGVGARMGAAGRTGLERVVGTDRTDQFMDWTTETLERTRALVLRGREKLRQSEHATLIVAIGGGAILIALLVAIGGAVGGSDPKASGPSASERAKVATPPAAKDAKADPAKAKAVPAVIVPMVPPARMRVNVYNVGSQTGKAKEIAAKLKGLGYGIGQVGNSKGQYDGATIVYPSGKIREAKLLSRRTGITNLRSAPSTATITEYSVVIS